MEGRKEKNQELESGKGVGKWIERTGNNTKKVQELDKKKYLENVKWMNGNGTSEKKTHKMKLNTMEENKNKEPRERKNGVN